MHCLRYFYFEKKCRGSKNPSRRFLMRTMTYRAAATVTPQNGMQSTNGVVGIPHDVTGTPVGQPEKQKGKSHGHLSDIEVCASVLFQKRSP